MAEGGRTIKSNKADDMLCCSICMKEYEDPRALPCLHTFCCRCLMQLSFKEGTISSSDVKLSSYIPSIFTASQQKEVLKCPVCSEEHPVPKDKGVTGFRKDFRIQKLKERQREAQTKEISKIVPGNEIEKCSFHTNEKLLYHCENESCKLDICEVCWTDSHDKHTVTLLSKKLKDARDALRKDVGKNMEMVLSHLKMLSAAKKEIDDQYDQVENDLKQRHKKMMNHLNTIFDQRLGQLEKQKKSQIENISDEIKNVSALKDSFQEIHNNVDKTNVPVSSKTVDQYSQWKDEMSQASSDLNRWTYSYKGVLLHDDKVTTPNPITTEDSIEITMAFSLHTILVNDQRDMKGAKEQQVRKPPDDLNHLMFSSSIDIIPAVHSIAVSRNNLLYAVNKNSLVCFEIPSEKKRLQKSFDEDMEEISAAALIYSKAGAEFVTVLHDQKKILRLFSPQQQEQMSTYVLSKQPSTGILASCGNLLAYTHNEGGKAFVSFLSLNTDAPGIFPYYDSIQLPFKSGKIRSMHLSISNKGNPILVSSGVFLQSTEKSDTALVITVLTNHIAHTQISYNELDSSSSAFDLRSLACDKDYIFVLNSYGNQIYRVTKAGLGVRKMKVTNKEFLFCSINRICLGSEVKKLYMSNMNNTIYIFKYF